MRSLSKAERVLTVLAVSVVALTLLLSSVAQAEPPKLISYGSFNSGRYPLGVAVDNSCTLHTPTLTGAACTTFDPSAGDVYVTALVLSKINKFDASNKLLQPPSPFGEGSERYSAAVVNPTNGTVYVLDALKSEIEPYDPITGKLVESASEKPFPVPPSRNFFGFYTVVQIGVDSVGDVYVPVIPENKVLEYSPAGTLLQEFTGGSGGGALKGPSGVAVDPSGDLWVADAGDNRIEELSRTGSAIGEIKSEGVQTLALDGRGDVLAIVKNSEDACGSVEPPCSHLVEYNSAGARVADVGPGSFEGGSGKGGLPPMVAANEVNGRAYVTSANIAGASLIWIFGPPSAPTVQNELTAEVTTSEAKLGALVNPGGLTATYRFEYDTREYGEGEGPHGQSTPFPEGNVGEGIESHAVWAAASGLAPGTTYHYRVIATNEVGVAVGRDQTFTTLTSAQAACANQEARVGFSARLPDCRAYELVLPPPKNSSEIETEKAGGPGNVAFIAALDGNALSFTTKEPLPGSPSAGSTYVATRAGTGWGSEAVVPLESYSAFGCATYGGKVRAWSEDLSKLIVSYGMYSSDSAPSKTDSWEGCNAEGRQVVSGEPVGYENLLLRENGTGDYRLVNTPESGRTPLPADAQFRASSPDLSHVVFTEPTPLTSIAAPGVESVYDWHEGVITLVSVLPNGTSVEGSVPTVPGGYGAGVPKTLPTEAHVVSGDGSHILFTSGGDLYVRVNAQRTVQIDESQGGPGASGGGVFQAASLDGASIFFLDESKLTEGSTAETNEPDLYECALPAGATKCELTDLTVAAAGEHADVLGVTVSSADSSHVYFVAKAVLAGNERAYTNTEGVAVTESAQSGKKNLYLWDGKATRFIATFGESDFSEAYRRATSPNGQWFAFDSFKSLNGYDNVDSYGNAEEEVYLYSAASNEIVCASCNPSGQTPVAGSRLTGLGAEPHYAFDSGRLFFSTSEALVPSDTNGQTDVYEYEDGHVYLISSGTGPSGSTFIDASERGDDVFFMARDQLVPQDTQPTAQVIYDARVNGGFPVAASPPPCTTADSCRTPVSPQPSIYGAPSSQTFSGAGNLAPAAATPKAKPKKKRAKKHTRVKKKACKHSRHKPGRCASQLRVTRAKAKSHKGGK